MKNIDEIKKVIATHKQELLEHYHVEHLDIFGSYARNEQTEKSDLDLLVDFNGMVGLMQVTELQFYLESLLGLKVDVVTRKALKPYMSVHIINEAVPV